MYEALLNDQASFLDENANILECSRKILSQLDNIIDVRFYVG